MLNYHIFTVEIKGGGKYIKVVPSEDFIIYFFRYLESPYVKGFGWEKV